jgi:hypothetical protein
MLKTGAAAARPRAGSADISRSSSAERSAMLVRGSRPVSFAAATGSWIVRV